MDKAYPAATKFLKKEDQLKYNFQLRIIKYLNNIIEQDHRFIKKSVRAGMNFRYFILAKRTLAGYEAMHMIKKNQIDGISKNNMKMLTNSASSLAKKSE